MSEVAAFDKVFTEFRDLMMARHALYDMRDEIVQLRQERDELRNEVAHFAHLAGYCERNHGGGA